jgi:flagellar basal-body rod protein FlgG
MQAQELAMDTIANNLANVSTNAFKASRINFQDMLYTVMRTPGAATSGGSSQVPDGIQIGHGTRVAEISHSFSQGALKETGRDLDLAIEGDGFFEVTQPDGTLAYTRDGSFRKTSSGQVVTTDGYQVNGFDAIDNGTTEVTIGGDGSFTTLVNGAVVTKTNVTLCRFPNPEGLRSMGRNLYVPTDASGPVENGIIPGENGTGTLSQRFVETSNVSVAEELVGMIRAQRAFEANSKAIKASDDMMSETNSLRR